MADRLWLHLCPHLKRFDAQTKCLTYCAAGISAQAHFGPRRFLRLRMWHVVDPRCHLSQKRSFLRQSSSIGSRTTCEGLGSASARS